MSCTSLSVNNGLVVRRTVDDASFWPLAWNGMVVVVDCIPNTHNNTMADRNAMARLWFGCFRTCWTVIWAALDGNVQIDSRHGLSPLSLLLLLLMLLMLMLLLLMVVQLLLLLLSIQTDGETHAQRETERETEMETDSDRDWNRKTATAAPKRVDDFVNLQQQRQGKQRDGPNQNTRDQLGAPKIRTPGSRASRVHSQNSTP